RLRVPQTQILEASFSAIDQTEEQSLSSFGLRSRREDRLPSHRQEAASESRRSSSFPATNRPAQPLRDQEKEISRRGRSPCSSRPYREAACSPCKGSSRSGRFD